MNLRARVRLSRPEWALLAVLAAWALVPIVAMIVRAAASGDHLTGADGPVAGDQLQYLAWVRDAGNHVLAANLFGLTPSPRVYLQPLFTISGLLWRAGVPLVAAYWVWKPVAVAVLFLGVALWARRMLTTPNSRLAALVLGVFLFTPLAALAGWTTIGSAADRSNVLILAGEVFSAGDLWGYLPTAIAIGLLPIALLASERKIASAERGRAARAPAAIAAGASLLASWLHPWQGVTLALILMAVGAWGTARDRRALLVPLLATLLPLIYYGSLSRLDPAWKLAAHNDVVSRMPVVILLVAIGPIVLVAIAGVRPPGKDLLERALLIWPVASIATYFLVSAFPSHAFEGLGLPLAVLAVRGWRRLPVPPVLGTLALAAITLPGMAYEARAFDNVASSSIQQYYLTPSDARALDWMAAHAPPGGLLARTIFAVGVPSQTDRAVWVGHEFWSRDYAARSEIADALFGGRLAAEQARLAVSRSRVRLVVSDCGAAKDPGPVLAPIVESAHHFGCASVYVVR